MVLCGCASYREAIQCVQPCRAPKAMPRKGKAAILTTKIALAALTGLAGTELYRRGIIDGYLCAGGWGLAAPYLVGSTNSLRIVAYNAWQGKRTGDEGVDTDTDETASE